MSDSFLIIENVRDLDLEQTLDCGQSFRWEKREDGSFAGVAFGRSVSVSLSGTELRIENAAEEDRALWEDYFDLSLDYAAIRTGLSALHPVLREAADYAPGIRILRQEPYEALCTFIISQNNNIKRIKGIVRRLCEGFGEPLPDGAFAFPAAERMAQLEVDDLAPLRAGFRSRYLIDAARKTASGEVRRGRQGRGLHSFVRSAPRGGVPSRRVDEARHGAPLSRNDARRLRGIRGHRPAVHLPLQPYAPRAVLSLDINALVR